MSGSCVSPDGSWSSSGGGEPDDGVVGEEESGPGGEFMAVVGQEMTRIRYPSAGIITPRTVFRQGSQSVSEKGPGNTSGRRRAA